MRSWTLKRTTAITCVVVSLECAIYAAFMHGNFELLGMVMISHSMLLGFMMLIHGKD